MPRYQALDDVTSLEQALEGMIVDDLKKLNALLSGNRKSTRKADLVAGIKEQMQGQKLKQVWAQLDHLQKAAVAEAIHGSDGCYDHDLFVAKYGQQPDWGSSDRYGYNREPSILSLFFYGAAIPYDLQEQLLKFVPKPQQTSLNQVGDILPDNLIIRAERYNFSTSKKEISEYELPLTIFEMERAAPKDFEAVLRLIQSGKVAVGEKTGLPGAATVKTIANLLQGGDFYSDEQRKNTLENGEIFHEVGNIKSFAWAAIAQASKFAEQSGKKLVLSKAGQKALQESPAKGLQTAWKRWLKTNTFDEFRRIDAIKGQTGKGARGMTAAAGRREKIAEILAKCPVGKWILFSEFSKYLLATGNRFEVTRDPDNLYISEFGYGNLGYSGSHDWHILQERYMRCLLFEYVATLGIIDVAYADPSLVPSDFDNLWGTDDLRFLSRYDGLISFRLTALGAYCLGLTDNYTPPAIEFRQTLRVLPNLDIVVAGEGIAASDAIVLDLYAKKVSDVVWQLDRQKLFTAIEAGYPLAEFQEVLATRTIELLPETVQQFLTDIAERSNSLQDLGTAKLIECTNAHLALLIANDSRTKKFCQLAGDRTLAVPLSQETKFRSALRQIGYVLPQRDK
ncbi:hypothetical protein QT971_25720 [Microcoleus sp. herbarium19]|uniref:hypothetical protein n=1 Tax=unclassified Microcoleus TaxID=2642155 RepID=UPI002FD3B683